MSSTNLTSPLPVSTQDLLAMRKTMQERTFNDHVDDIHVILWSNPEYHRALEAVYDEEAVEGSTAADNFIAAGMIREHGRTMGNPRFKEAKLATIVKSLNIVLRRYGISRNQRKYIVGGVAVPQNETNGE